MREGLVNNHITEHHRLMNHTIDLDSAQCLREFSDIKKYTFVDISLLSYPISVGHCADIVWENYFLVIRDRD